MISIHFDKIKYNRGETAVITHTDADVPCKITMGEGPRGLRLIDKWEISERFGTISYPFPYTAQIYTCTLWSAKGFGMARDIAELAASGEPPAKCRVTSERSYYKRGEKLILKYINAPSGTSLILAGHKGEFERWYVSGTGTKEYVLPSDAILGVHEYGLHGTGCADGDDYTIGWARVEFKSDPSGASIEVIKA
jgi:hypothetical protein